jgi:hypothetical protein
VADDANPITQDPTDFGSDFAMRNFQIKSVLSRIAGATLATVIAVDSVAGTVDVQPLVNQTDGYGNAIPHGVIHGFPYFQLQSGLSAIVITPTIGDIGTVIFADRDISAVKATRKASNPATRRMFDMADGLYFGGMLNAAPTQFIKFDATGIAITSPVAVTLHAPSVTIANGGAALALLNANAATWLAAHVHTAAGTPTSPPTIPMPTNGQTTVVTAQ